MVENRFWLNLLSHLVLGLGVLLVAFPIWIAFVASTHSAQGLVSGTIPFWPGDLFLENFSQVLSGGNDGSVGVSAMLMLFNSLVMALGISIGKIVISLMAAYAIVFFRFPLRSVCFWIIFMTLMLPVEVRIMPTFQVVANLNLLDSYTGLTLPLIASATATFLLRQFYMTIPPELVEAARVDGAGPVKFLFDILLPLSRTNLAALFVIMFIYGWNQYLWPLLVTTDEHYYTIVMGIQRMLAVGDDEVAWNIVMPTTLLAMLPPVGVVLMMQRLFVKGLVETEK
ncbi:Glycerol-3-phosphate ABC transporter, permease protein UgpE [Marinobacterium lacunae]|uniref:sn-glycerol-3-phosphate transport system permease protein UgpE n=1 Tax=Marinobacterium lacunae TaxID=1232683 RepID=A0A081G1T2_9GAMM|nr:sn-glycerol-3-phosphate ABC transporter permease UgpE [Marinobacterium lacunae]KEA64737.1 Glycerol-3-phosphate ABC transporter, permease protein UgpE [Marinobacterium lacunae]